MKILLPIDQSSCSEAAADAVIAQFSPATTDVRVMHAVEWPKELPNYLAFAEGPTAARDTLRARGDHIESARVFVEEVARRLRAAGFTTTTDVRDGITAADCILAAAAEWQPDTIVIGSHSRHGLARLFLGSVAEHVMRHAECAVEIVPMSAHAAELPGQVTSVG
jgi:nucleotide-binding universal stress UspA family protein